MKGTKIIGVIAAAAVIGTAAYRLAPNKDSAVATGRQPAPVEVANIERGTIELHRTFSGALQAHAEFSVTAKVGGRIRAMQIDIGDTVANGQVVLELDNAEYELAVTQAAADLAVARAYLSQARSDLNRSTREWERAEVLEQRGMNSEAELDVAKAGLVATEAQLEVAGAQVTRAVAALEGAHIRLRYTRVKVAWTDGDGDRVVAERYVDVGQAIAPGEPLVRVVELSPLTGVLHVTEKDYGRLAVGQTTALTTDAWPGEVFSGAIARIAPVFRENSRQARVEVEVPNREQRLKPGMFVRASVVLQRDLDALHVPEAALTSRADQMGVFVVDGTGKSVAWRPVAIGIRDAGRVQISGDGLTGQVVTLGQQMLDDGAPILIPADNDR